jgi:adenylate cyclase, class 2
VCIQSRVLERNLRFDTPDGRLGACRQVLRLRQDALAHLTFKGAAVEGQPVAIRSEIEFVVSDFAAARDFLEALGYEVRVIYEKYRASYMLDGAEISVDEMPYGLFCEIEAGNADLVKEVADRLGLKWDERITDSYLVLFDRIKTKIGLEMRDLTFDNFARIQVDPKMFRQAQ